MRGHHHNGDPSLTQNQGNTLGDRPCVRQSRLYREHVGGNAMKDIMGQGELKWDTTQTQGVYAGGRVYEHDRQPGGRGKHDNAQTQQQQQQQSQQQSQQQQQQQQSHEQRNHQLEPPVQELQIPEEVEISMDALENLTPTAQQTATEKETLQQHSTTPVASRSFRPGAGYANKQTYNIFTGE